jgi:hypothetical protein
MGVTKEAVRVTLHMLMLVRLLWRMRGIGPLSDVPTSSCIGRQSRRLLRHIVVLRSRSLRNLIVVSDLMHTNVRLLTTRKTSLPLLSQSLVVALFRSLPSQRVLLSRPTDG